MKALIELHDYVKSNHLVSVQALNDAKLMTEMSDFLTADDKAKAREVSDEDSKSRKAFIEWDTSKPFADFIRPILLADRANRGKKAVWIFMLMRRELVRMFYQSEIDRPDFEAAHALISKQIVIHHGELLTPSIRCGLYCEFFIVPDGGTVDDIECYPQDSLEEALYFLANRSGARK